MLRCAHGQARYTVVCLCVRLSVCLCRLLQLLLTRKYAPALLRRTLASRLLLQSDGGGGGGGLNLIEKLKAPWVLMTR